MRNLEQYPITTDEIVQCLKELMDEVAYEKTGLVGDMRPVLLANAIRLISASAPAQRALDEEVYRGLQEVRVILDRIVSAVASTERRRPDFCATADPICHYPACSCARWPEDDAAFSST